MIGEFLDEAFAGLDIDPEFEARMRSVTPELPAEPTPEQLAAAAELEALLRDPGFRTSIRTMAERQSSERRAGRYGDVDYNAAAAIVARAAGGAVEQGVDPHSPEAEQVVVKCLAAFKTEDRTQLADHIEAGMDPRAERYWQLLAFINGWPPIPSTTPAWQWLVSALR